MREQHGSDGSPSSPVSPVQALDRVWLAVLAGTALLGAVVNVWAFRDYVFEDAYITYCYAQNVAAGDGLVFNIGERLLGTTTPLYALLLGLLSILGADIPLASGILFASSLAAIGMIGALVLARLGARWAGLLFNLAMALGVGNWTWQWGMETAFYTTLLFAAWYAALLGKPTLAGIAMGLAFVTRYDAALFAIILLSVQWARDRRPPVRAGLAALAVVVPWLGFAQLYYGSVMPTTLGAKLHKTTILEYMAGSLERQAEHLLSPAMPLVPPHELPDWIIASLGLAVVALSIYATIRFARTVPLIVVPGLFSLTLWLAYSLIGPPISHSWHLLPAATIVLFLACLGVARLGAHRLLADRWNPTAGRAFGAVLLAVGGLALGPLASMRADQLTDSDDYRGRVGTYLDIARWINDKGLNDLKILVNEPGYLRFLTGNPMVDAAGLVTSRPVDPESGRVALAAHRWMNTYRPDLVVAPPRTWSRLDLSAFMPLMHATPLRTVHIRRSVFAERFDDLAARWRAPTPPERVADTIDADLGFVGIDGDRVAGWTTSGLLRSGYVREKTPHGSGPIRLEAPILSTWGRQWGGLVSPRFVIDFDELRFRMAASSRTSTLVRLLIDGQAVLVEAGEDATVPMAREVRWSVRSWRGRVAALQLVDIDPGKDFVAVSDIRRCRHEGFEMLADFETGTYADDRWQATFAPRPRSNRRLARQQGVHFEVGRFAASTAGVGGRRSLVSEPFRIERDQLSFLAFDFGARSRVELTVDGNVVRAWHGSRSGRLRSVVWDLSEWVGRQAVLAAHDDEVRPSGWFGIDEILAFDRGSDHGC